MLSLSAVTILPDDQMAGTLVGRAWLPAAVSKKFLVSRVSNAAVHAFLEMSEKRDGAWRLGAIATSDNTVSPYGQKIKSARKPGSYLLPV